MTVQEQSKAICHPGSNPRVVFLLLLLCSEWNSCQLLLQKINFLSVKTAAITKNLVTAGILYYCKDILYVDYVKIEISNELGYF